MRIRLFIPDLLLLGGLSAVLGGVWQAAGVPGLLIVGGTLTAAYGIWLEMKTL